jgi:hypothetical protein
MCWMLIWHTPEAEWLEGEFLGIPDKGSLGEGGRGGEGRGTNATYPNQW